MTLIENLARGRQLNTGLAVDLVQRWKDKFRAHAEMKEVGENSLRFVVDLSEIRLRGMNETACLLLGGEGEAVTEALHAFRQKHAVSAGVPFVLAVSEAALAQAQAVLPAERCLILNAPQVTQLLESAESRTLLTQWLREQIPLRRLVPYNHLLSVEGGMFFGRRQELERLHHDADVSFAVAGPGRIGKTSLVKQYKYELARARDPQSTRCVYIDFYHCRRFPNDVARFLAMALESSRRSSEVTAAGLVDFLKYMAYRLGGRIDLLLDEVDEVCDSGAFDYLGEAAKHGHCRLILCGRGRLLKTMTQQSSSLAHRLDLMRLNPLDEESARTLLAAPLRDLGFELEEPERLFEQVFRLTGRLPNFMQFYARKLVELAIDERRNTLSAAQAEMLQWDFETAQFFISPLQDISSDRARFTAMMLLKDTRREFTPTQVCRLAAQHGLPLKDAEMLEICNELVIVNVLAWDRGVFRVANEALTEFARQLGVLDRMYDEARRELSQQTE